MKLLIKQKVFSWTDTYDVYDEFGTPRYFVKADMFSIGHRIRVYDKSTGNEIGVIQEKVLRLLKEFEISIGGKPMGRIKREFSFFVPKYNIDYKNWHLEGDFMHWNYSVYEGSRYVVNISKQLFQWGDTYVLDIVNPMDELPALMVAIAMDAALCSQDDNHNTLF